MYDYNLSILEKGKCYLEIGPVSMVISASDKDPVDTIVLHETAKQVVSYLQELTTQIPLLKSSWTEIDPSKLNKLGYRLWKSVEVTGDKLLTPMASIAGLMSDLTADFLYSRGATKIFVNNGGDIALRLKAEDTVKLGVISSFSKGTVDKVIEISGKDNIRGVATSGLGGRSFTLGIAEAVTVLGTDPLVTDACATVVANQSCITSDKVIKKKIAEIDPYSDIAELYAVTEVMPLTEAEISRSLGNLKEAAEYQRSLGNISKMIGFVQGKEVSVNI